MNDTKNVQEIINKHECSGKYIDVNGITCFALDEGSGEAVLCLHGVPTSSFLYRKIIPALATKGFRGVSIDFPGLGLSDKPAEYDYSFSSLADFTAQAAEKLGLDKYHLVIHDIGGPIGFALAARNPEKILSITILNTWIDVVNFKKPWPMRPFEVPVLGEIELLSMQYPTWQLLYHKMGVNDSSMIPKNEINAHIDLLKKNDGGEAFLKIMRSFNDSEDFKSLCYQAVQGVSYPIQAVWGADDPFLTLEEKGEEIKKATGLSTVHELSSRHFLQEEKPMEIVAMVEEIILRSKKALEK